jgi:hypothetical protein
MQCHADLKGDGVRPQLGVKSDLGGKGSGERIGRRGESGAERIAHGPEYHTPVTFDGPSQ